MKFLLFIAVLCFFALSSADYRRPPHHPGCKPANCEHNGTIPRLDDKTVLAKNGVTVLNQEGECCLWNPFKSGPGNLLPALAVTLHMQSTDDLIVATNDTLLDLTVQLSGGDLALKACLPAFTFTLLASTADANGLLGLGGFLWSDGTVFLPLAYASSSANYATFQLSFTPIPGEGARPPIYANFFNDGSLRITGPQGVPIPAGTYNVKPACIIYSARRNTRPPPLNVLISDADCLNTIAETLTFQDNFATLTGNYYEYFGLDYYNGIAYIAGMENCYPASNNGSKWFKRAMLTSFYKVARSGAGLARLSYIPVVDGSLADDSVAVLQNEFSMTGRLNRVDIVRTNQQEAGIAVGRLDANKIAFVHASQNVPINTGAWQAPFSLDGGLTWNTSYVNLPDQVGIPGGQMLPYPQIFQNLSWSCGYSVPGVFHCPPIASDTNIITGGELQARNSIYPNSGGDNRMVVDAFDVFWQVGLYIQGVAPNDVFANAEITYSLDYGKTWFLAADFAMANGSAYSYDYNVVAAGPDGRSGSQFCVAIKVDANVDELITFGTILPIELNCFHTSKRGIVDAISRVSMAGTEPGHYGGMDIGLDGTIYLVLQGMQPSVSDPTTGGVLGVGVGPLGSNILDNAPIMFTSCTASPNVVCQRARVIARTDMGTYCPNPQSFRCTWSLPQLVIDKRSNLYIIWVDLVHNTLTTTDEFFAFVPTNQNTRVLMIKSCDGGATWSAPQSINDDATDPADPFTTPNIHFNPVIRYDPVSDTILAAWMDTRVDPQEQTATQIFATVITL